MDSERLSRAILEVEWVGLLLYVVVAIVGAAVVSFLALSSTDRFAALDAAVSVDSGVVVLGVVPYLETRVWGSD